MQRPQKEKDEARHTASSMTGGLADEDASSWKPPDRQTLAGKTATSSRPPVRAMSGALLKTAAYAARSWAACASRTAARGAAALARRTIARRFAHLLSAGRAGRRCAELYQNSSDVRSSRGRRARPAVVSPVTLPLTTWGDTLACAAGSAAIAPSRIARQAVGEDSCRPHKNDRAAPARAAQQCNSARTKKKPTHDRTVVAKKSSGISA